VKYHLAQVNIAVAKYDYDDPRFAGFVDNLDRVYALAESTPGFVWRHASVDGDPEAKEIFGEPRLIYNASMWESRTALAEFVYRNDHAGILRQRADWFEPMSGPVFALWWQSAGTVPGFVEARHRLECLRVSGPTQDAFTFRNFFDAPVHRKEPVLG